jgi:hypothetical protein
VVERRAAKRLAAGVKRVTPTWALARALAGAVPLGLGETPRKRSSALVGELLFVERVCVRLSIEMVV